MAKNALVILAQGFEEIEAITAIDVLRRAGIDVTVAGLGGVSITGSRSVKVTADTDLDSVHGEFDALVLPGGGKGADNLAASEKVVGLARAMAAGKKVVAAICAAPAVVLAPAGILDNRQATCFPGMEELFRKSTRFKEERVVVDGTVITSRAAGTAFPFALAIVEQLAGKEVAQRVASATLGELP